MSERLEALRALKSMVEAGQRPAREPWDIEDDCPVNPHALLKAFDGSLDAAKALHEAVLPGWRWTVAGDGSVSLSDAHRVAYVAKDAARPPARAWLIAILSALIAIEEQAQ